MLNFRSSHSIQQKIAIVKAFKHRAVSLSHADYKSESLEYIRHICRKNYYPNTLINKILSEEDPSPKADGPDPPSTSQARFYKIPYIPHLYQKLKTILKSEHTNIVPYPTKLMRNVYTGIKDVTPKIEKSHLVYSIPCNNCGLKYIGQTKQKLKARIRNHETDCKMYNSDKSANTALARHRFSTLHTFNFDDTRILETETNLGKRKILESIHIKKTNDYCINKQENNLSAMYDGLLFS